MIKVSAPASELVSLTLGDSSTVRPGQGVIAIGSAFGYPETITAGIVSAVDRDISALNGYSIADAIQTDAAINHGNSGGHLIDESGDVIGINDQLPVGSSASNGVGFAVPSNDVRTSADDLIAGKPVEHAYLGIAITDATSEPGAAVGLVRAGSPAATAGIKAGDIVTVADSIKVTPTRGRTALPLGARVGSDAPPAPLIEGATSDHMDSRPAEPRTDHACDARGMRTDRTPREHRSLRAARIPMRPGACPPEGSGLSPRQGRNVQVRSDRGNPDRDQLDVARHLLWAPVCLAPSPWERSEGCGWRSSAGS